MANPSRVTINGDQPRWLVDFGVVQGKRRRKFYRTKSEAVHALDQFEEEQSHAGDVWAQMAPGKRAKVATTLLEMSKAGVTLDEVWQFFQDHRAVRNGRKLKEVSEEFLIAKKSAGVSEKYHFELNNYLSQFQLDRETMDIADVTPAVLDAWFAGRKESPSTRQTGMNRLSALFSFCERRGYIRENPIKRLERVRVPHVKPEILSVEECQRLVKAAEKDEGMLTYVGLALFCGIRPDEALRIDQKEIDLERGIVILDAEKSKVRNRRIIELTEPAKRCIQAGGAVPAKNFKRRFNKLRKDAEIKKWPHDALRKTAASHFYNIYGIEKATEQLGHSAGVLLRVYREVVSKGETEKWLGIGDKSQGVS